MEPNPDTETPTAASSSTTDEKDSILKAFATPHKSPFLWRNCENKEQRDRVDIKQQAVCDGLKFGETISRALKSWHSENNQETEVPELMNWVKDFDNVKKEYQSYRGPAVGFLGVLGAGKTSLINALLGEEELLTSSSEQAATAVVCEVAYNHEASDYRAEVVYRTRKSVAEQLDKMFANLKWKADLELRKEALEDNPDDDNRKYSEIEAIDDQIADTDESISETLDIVSIIWGLSEEDLKTMSTQSLLNADCYGAEYLGTTREVPGTDREAFADELMQYLTSASEDTTGLGLPRRPLIEKVVIYIKSDLLKYGLIFVDSPGLCDASESRSNIARKIAKDLGIIVIVAQAIRASDEKTAVNLIEEQHLGVTEMKMDGKLDRSSFCVVLSKTDDIKSETLLKKRAKTDKSIDNKLRRVKELDMAFNRARSRKRKFEDQRSGQSSLVLGNDAALDENRREAFALKEWLEHTAISMRNRDITERIQRKFQESYGNTGLTQTTGLHRDPIEVFGVSNKAYWMSKHLDGEKARGFPHEKHSGIPRLRQWLFETTFTHREKHLLDPTLKKLSDLLLGAQNWIGWESNNMTTETDAKAVQRTHNSHLENFTSILRSCGEDLSRIDPLMEKETALKESRDQCSSIVESWKFKYPPSRNNDTKLQVNVQTCILRKKGGLHETHRRYPDRQTYHWRNALTQPFLNVIQPSWTRTFQEIVPDYENDIMDSTQPEWQKYGAALALLQGPTPNINDLNRIQVAIDSGRSDLRLRIRARLNHLKEQASDVYPNFEEDIKETLSPVFEEALGITGPGCRTRRETHLENYFKDHSASMFKKGSETLDAGLLKLFQQCATDLEGIAVEPISLVEKLVQPLFGAHRADASPTARNTTMQVQKETEHSLTSWRACWETPPSPREDHVMRGDMSIPDPVLIKVEDDEDGVMAATTSDVGNGHEAMH